ncbi:MAG TPA: SOS response-associated peptidase [Tepidisphaeraceae bacterium]|nr:SOS response-associated peptidase [Tepidisphaeraceae bacterium]
MCGRYTLRRIDARRLGVAYPHPLFEEFTEHPRFNVAPSQDVAVVRVNANGDRVLGLVRWGLIPSWTTGKPKAKPINARAETAATSGMFKRAFESRRCLVPADGFYEWLTLDDPPRKQPMFVRHPDDRPFCFAGLWERWRPSPDAEPVDTCAILTTAPNGLMRPIHDRMPAILAEADYARWLDRTVRAAGVADLLRPYPDGELETVPVSRLVNSPKNDVPACIAPLNLGIHILGALPCARGPSP